MGSPTALHPSSCLPRHGGVEPGRSGGRAPGGPRSGGGRAPGGAALWWGGAPGGGRALGGPRSGEGRAGSAGRAGLPGGPGPQTPGFRPPGLRTHPALPSAWGRSAGPAGSGAGAAPGVSILGPWVTVGLAESLGFGSVLSSGPGDSPFSENPDGTERGRVCHAAPGARCRVTERSVLLGMGGLVTANTVTAPPGERASPRAGGKGPTRFGDVSTGR